MFSTNSNRRKAVKDMTRDEWNDFYTQIQPIPMTEECPVCGQHIDGLDYTRHISAQHPEGVAR